MSQVYLSINKQQVGPYDIPSVNQMISNGQVSKETLGWIQGMPGWEPLSSDTFINQGIGNKLKQILPSTPPPQKQQNSELPTNQVKRVEDSNYSTLHKGKQTFQIGKVIREAFAFYRANIVPSITWLILVVIMGAIPVVNLIVPLMGVNFYTCVRNFREKEEKMSLNSLFDFSFALNKIIGPVVVGILIALGYACLIIPGIILTFMWAFTPCIQGDMPELSFIESMKKSRNLAKGNYFKIFLLVIILAILAFSGFVIVGFGALVTIPVAHVALYCAYDQCKT